MNTEWRLVAVGFGIASLGAGATALYIVGMSCMYVGRFALGASRWPVLPLGPWGSDGSLGLTWMCWILGLELVRPGAEMTPSSSLQGARPRMVAESRPHVLYLGDWVFHVGPVFIETPFALETKDCDLHFYGERLASAFRQDAELTCLANWSLYRLEPGKLEDLVERSSTVVISDVEAKCFHLYPSFFDRARREARVVSFPDRLESLKTWVRGGGGLMMLGGWLSFSGAREMGGWRRSRLADVLPVECLVGEDLVESSAGFTAEVVEPDHPLAVGLPWDSFPPVFGYNELVARPHGKVIVRVRETGHPLVVAGDYGRGRVCIYASDPAPHWGLNFELWEGYDAFWRQALRWTSRRD